MVITKHIPKVNYLLLTTQAEIIHRHPSGEWLEPSQSLNMEGQM